MSQLAVNAVTDANGGNTATINSMTLQQRFNEAFEYRNGKIYWKINTNKSKNLIGKEAGCKSSGAYGSVMIDKKAYCVHRIIYCMHTGEWPEVVDHINNDPQDHRIENLRAANHSTNNMNKSPQSNNKSGVKNVCWNKPHQKWSVQIQANKKRVFSKLFDDLELAELVAIEARAKYHGEFARSI
jgi:hypothetical protein